MTHQEYQISDDDDVTTATLIQISAVTQDKTCGRCGQVTWASLWAIEIDDDDPVGVTGGAFCLACGRGTVDYPPVRTSEQNEWLETWWRLKDDLGDRPDPPTPPEAPF